jgi:hypothetical protein
MQAPAQSSPREGQPPAEAYGWGAAPKGLLFFLSPARAGMIMALANDAAYQDMASMFYREDDTGGR